MEYIKAYNDDFTCETAGTANNTDILTFTETTISDFSSRTDELKRLDDELNRLKNIDDNMNEIELLNTDDIKTDLFKAMILQLQHELVNLKDDIKFMRNEMAHKNKLIYILAGQSIRSTPEKRKCSENDSSI